MGRYVLTFGSLRQSEEFSLSAQGHGLEVFHLSEADPEDRVLPPEAIAETSANMIARLGSVDTISCLSFGRGSVPGGISSIAQAWGLLTSRGLLERAKLLGPSPIAAQTFEDKLESLQTLRRDGFVAVPVVQTASAVPAQWRRPLFVKPRTLTGGAGIGTSNTLSEVREHATKLVREGHSIVVSPFIFGFEVSFECLVLGNDLWPMSAIYKEATSEHYRHGEWIIKIAFPLEISSEAVELLRKLAMNYGVQGLLSVEGILEPASGRFNILEVATRRTGNFIVSNAMVPGNGIYEVLSKWIVGKDPIPKGKPQFRTAIQFPFDKAELGADFDPSLVVPERFLGADYDDLAQLPGSQDSRKRIRLVIGSETAGTVESLDLEELTRIQGIGQRVSAILDGMRKLGLDPDLEAPSYRPYGVDQPVLKAPTHNKFQSNENKRQDAV